jgi:hypothetical protein
MGRSPFLTSIYERMREMRYAKRTIEAYIHGILDFINALGQPHCLPSTFNDSGL